MIKRLKLFFLLAITIIICCGISLILIETVTAKQPVISHPLTALTEAEIKTAVALIRKEKSLTDMAAFPLITLAEPDKQEVRNFTQGQSFERKAFLVVYERAQNKTYEGIVDLKTQKIASWQEKPHVQPAIFNSEYELARNVVKSDSRWQEAMKKRGITDFDQVQVSCWAAGILSQEEAATGGRL